MRVVVAPDKFKGSLGAGAVARAIADGFADVIDGVDTTLIPMADGGEGTVDTFLESGARPIGVRVRGPLGEPVSATFAVDGATAVVEMAAASGLVLLAAAERDALRASSYGTGELMRAAIDAGARTILVGIGGSATNDGGAGMLSALGVRFLDARGEALAPGGAALASLAHVDASALDPRLREVDVEVACDVTNPLLGPRGASAVFGPQKGASAGDVATLDAALARYADVVEAAVGRRVRDEPGTGAAGGLGFGLRAVLGARLRPGVEIVAEVRGLDAALAGAALCVTGEGRIDEQTLSGKVVDGVARLARARGVPVIALAGAIDPAVERELWARGVAAFSILDGPRSFDDAVARAGTLVRAAAARAARLVQTPMGVVGAPLKRT